MLVSGLNDYDQLGESSNNKNFSETPCISPALPSHLNASNLLSLSTYSAHSVNVNKDGQAFAVGDNSDCRICATLPKTALRTDTEIKLTNKQIHSVKFMSAVCGEFYTLFLVTDDANENVQLAYSYKDHEDGPIFIDTDSSIPRYLFGGAKTSAAITLSGGIVIVTENIFQAPKAYIETVFLPNNDKAIKLACCDKFILALGSSGHVYECSALHDDHPKFVEIPDFSGKEVVDIAGSHRHCFVVLNDGRVFGRGANEDCRLGMPQDTRYYQDFVEISALKGNKITAAFAGYVHSLFKTSDGKLLGCGSNFCGPLMQDGDLNVDPVFPPAEAKIAGPVCFCIAGNGTTIVFQDELPKNTPNHRISE